MERDLDILMLRQQIEEEQPRIKQQQQQQVWSYGEKPMKTPRVAQYQTMTQSTPENKKFTRDAINTRMGDRDLLVQVGGNPFLSNNNYVKDIANRDQYLVARDSNFN
uniref:Uncharacterized protein n=1 Tax=viral metagenome TaxID=1070528 RepID=A0A6C0BVD4_9ZZZZ